MKTTNQTAWHITRLVQDSNSHCCATQRLVNVLKQHGWKYIPPTGAGRAWLAATTPGAPFPSYEALCQELEPIDLPPGLNPVELEVPEPEPPSRS